MKRFSKVSKKQQFYYLSLLGLGIAIGWILWNRLAPTSTHINPCIFNQITGIPCPSCGSTRSLFSLFEGNLSQAFWFNPIGYLYFTVGVIAPAWISYDLISSKTTLYEFSIKAVQWIKRPPVFTGILFLIMVNWAWNVIKYML